MLKLKTLPWALTVCKPASAEQIDPAMDFYFLGRTDEEISLVCRTEDTPEGTLAHDDYDSGAGCLYRPCGEGYRSGCRTG